MDKNVTDLADFQENDGEYLPLKRCPCGAEFQPWSFILSIYRDSPNECPHCNRKLYFTSAITVWEVADPQDNEGAK